MRITLALDARQRLFFPLVSLIVNARVRAGGAPRARLLMSSQVRRVITCTRILLLDRLRLRRYVPCRCCVLFICLRY